MLAGLRVAMDLTSSAAWERNLRCVNKMGKQKKNCSKIVRKIPGSGSIVRAELLEMSEAVACRGLTGPATKSPYKARRFAETDCLRYLRDRELRVGQ